MATGVDASRLPAEEAGMRAEPRYWLPLMVDAYEALKELAKRYGAELVVAGAGAYSLHVEPDTTRHVDLVLSSPLGVQVLVELLDGLRKHLEGSGYRVVGARVQHGRAPEDWVAQLFVAVAPGLVVAVEVFNLLAVRPLSLYETVETRHAGRALRVLSLESWVASKLADPNGVDAWNVRRMERAVDRGLDKGRLYGVLAGLGMHETVRLNARSVLERTASGRLRELLSALA
ncbi:MAG: hypothetical protein F7C07_02260 [Desulfurococcales archaeon]|nr:hypothetical protein [Desulfurococcales archaeon]